MSNMKAVLSKCDWYPVYCLDQSSLGIEIPNELYARYMENIEEFDEIQAQLRPIYEGKLSNKGDGANE